MEQVEEWVEHVRVLSRGHEDPGSNPRYWACSKYPTEMSMSDFTKVKSKYRIPDEIRLIFPSKADKPCDLLKIGLADLAAKKILLVMRGKEADKNQKKELAGLSIKSSEKTSTP
ncbi:hypothetical protein Fot_05646 [Forsythia ovata]|uniref:Uncharacterized protein n=1 Tax=Forsythia ovata TaxID=205694 RepID=A0ABD1WQP9_9LAMI